MTQCNNVRGLRRLGYLRRFWVNAVLWFCTLYTLLAALAFLLNPFWPSIARDSIFGRWGEPGLLVFGVVFLALFCWSMLVPERDGRLVATTMLGIIGVYTSARPHPIAIGLIFWSPILATAVWVAGRGALALLARRRGAG